MEKKQQAENVIIADANYIDQVAFHLTVNFERMLGRRIPPADLARWIDCVALDGGVREGEEETHVVLIHDKGKRHMENFLPADFAEELDGKAFRDHLGEFSISALAVEDMVERNDFFLDILGTVCTQKDVKRVMVIPNAEEGTLYDDIRETLRRLDEQTENKRITVFSMEPRQGGNFRQEILGYSLMAALGIRGEEFGQGL
ncbi:MAG: hypothetical protein IJS97_00555 [Prevotella sp.]|nr:hypothetical protein [Prevotella sp.]